MQTISQIGQWFDFAVIVGSLALNIWALIDCSSRKAAAFTAVDRLTKPVWLAILVVAAVLTLAAGSSILALIALVAACVYLVDVRPAIKDITGR